jgi:hypothetical protein
MRGNRAITIDVKGLKSNTSFPIDNLTKKHDDHFIVFVSYSNKIELTTYSPEVFVVPSLNLNLKHKELAEATLLYQNPKGTRKVVPLGHLRKVSSRYQDNWEPFRLE